MNINVELMLMLVHMDEHNGINSYCLIFCMRGVPMFIELDSFLLLHHTQLSAKFFCLLKILAFFVIMFTIIDISFSWRLFALSSVCCTCLFKKHRGMHLLPLLLTGQ